MLLLCKWKWIIVFIKNLLSKWKFYLIFVLVIWLLFTFPIKKLFCFYVYIFKFRLKCYKFEWTFFLY